MPQISDSHCAEQMLDRIRRTLQQVKQMRLNELKQIHPTAQIQGKTECCHSGICCWRRPGEVGEADIPRLSQGLGLSDHQLFKEYLVVDRVRGALLLRLRRRHELAGRMLDWSATWSLESPCVFLDEMNRNKCKVHAFKPAACRKYNCWEPRSTPIGGISKEYLNELGWDGRDPDRDRDQGGGS